ncbi:MAG: histidine phosphatase family protein [Acidimicrobiales bacterium]|nr:histidine phosphatase family protein [Acidimicrobiales bacterium]
MKIILVRHGTTNWSLSGRHTGLTDIPLNDSGINQAKLLKSTIVSVLSEDLASISVFSSPLRRAYATAKLATGLSSDKIAISDELREYNYGKYEGLTPFEIRQIRSDWDIWDHGCPGGESIEDVGKRAQSFLNQIADEPKPVLVFAHGHIIRVISAIAIGLTAPMGKIFTLDTSAISIIDNVRGKHVIKLWNYYPALVSSKNE